MSIQFKLLDSAKAKFLRLSLLTLVIVLAGCTIIEPQPPGRVIEPQITLPERVKHEQSYGSIRVLRPESDQTRDSRQILVRRDDSSLQALPQHLWLEKAPDLLRSVMLDSFRRSGPFDDAATGGSADWILTTSLRRFEAVDYGDGSYGVEIELFVRLIQQQTGRPLLSRFIQIERSSAGNQPNDWITSFEQALSQTLIELTDWLSEGAALTE